MAAKATRLRSSWWKRTHQAFQAKWKLADERDEVRFRLVLRDREIEDLENRLEAYKDALVALNRGNRLEGVAYEKQLEKLMASRNGAR